MNAFNRIVLVLLLLAFVVCGISVAVLTWTVPDESINALDDAVGWLRDNNNDLERALVSSLGLFVAVLALILVLFELLPRSSADVKVTGLRVGDAYLSTAAIGQRVEEVVSRVANVADVRAIVRTKRQGVLVSLDLHVDPQADLALVTDEACEVTREVLANQIHVDLAAPPRARLHYRELLLSRGAARRLQPPPEPEVASPPASPGPETAAPTDAPSVEAEAESPSADAEPRPNP